MGIMKCWLKRVETRTLVWLVRSRLSSFVLIGILAAAGLGSAVLSRPSTSGTRYVLLMITPSTQQLTMAGCYNDPDGDGHLFCDGSVGTEYLPAAIGPCRIQRYNPVPIICRGMAQQQSTDPHRLVRLGSS
jgi:hypothetical protein